MSAARISAAKVRRVIEQRRQVCADAAQKYAARATDTPGCCYANAAATERCAEMELQHLLGLLFGDLNL